MSITAEQTDVTDKIGTLPGGGAPAAWWFSDDASNIDAFRRFESDQQQWFDDFERFAASHGAKGEARVNVNPFGGSVRLAGLRPQNHRAIPAGWRYLAGKGFMVPSRKTKADRDSDLATGFAALSEVPTPINYVAGMPASVLVNDRVARVDVRMLDGGSVVVAFCSIDPDRLDPDGRATGFSVDETKWERLPLSTFHLLRENQDLR